MQQYDDRFAQLKGKNAQPMEPAAPRKNRPTGITIEGPRSSKETSHDLGGKCLSYNGKHTATMENAPSNKPHDFDDEKTRPQETIYCQEDEDAPSLNENTQHCPRAKENALFPAKSAMKPFFNETLQITMPMSANENPE
jgi:hypothetical protein